MKKHTTASIPATGGDVQLGKTNYPTDTSLTVTYTKNLPRELILEV